MKLGVEFNSVPIWHDCRSGFGEMLRLALVNKPIIAALGPIYQIDPAESILAPFVRSAIETGWDSHGSYLLHPMITERVRRVRAAACQSIDTDLMELIEWSRAGLVLEIARLRGINVQERGLLRPAWKLRGTVTGRFGCEPVRGETYGKNWTFNPLSLGQEDRQRVLPSDPKRAIAVLDFRGMDVCSMISIVPGLDAIYSGSQDHHQRTSDLTGLPRESAKLNFLSWAYGARLDRSISDVFDRTFPLVRSFTAGLEHGDFPRLVQSASSRAFRAALSNSLPLLVGEGLMPMFTVHDELTIDCVDEDSVGSLIKSLEAGASNRMGVPYRVGVSFGPTYDIAKGTKGTIDAIT